MAKAAEMLSITKRTSRRWNPRYEAERREGTADGRIGRASGRAVPVGVTLPPEN